MFLREKVIDCAKIMPTVPFCDILSVSPKDFEHKKPPSMPHQSARIKSAALEKTAQNGETPTHNDAERENKMKNGYSVKTFYSNKASVDILNEVKPNNSGRKRKANFETKIGHESNEQDTVKQIKVKEEEKGESEGEENSKSQYSPEKSFEDLSEYEKMCRKNIEEKEAFFASLNFDDVKQEFAEASLAMKNKKPRRKVERLNIMKERPTSVRKSLRLQRISPTGLPLSKLEVVEPVIEQKLRKPHKPLSFQELFKSTNQDSEKLIKDMSTLSEEKLKFEPVPYDRYESYFSRMKINSSLITKVAPSRIFSLAIHPSADKTLICAGSKYGHLSFWDVDSKNPQGGVYVYEPHSSRPVNTVAFNINKPQQVLSLSYDGTMRCGHLDAGIFDEVFYIGDDDYEDVSPSSFDFLSPDSLIISLSSGEVTVVDMRTPSRDGETKHLVHSSRIKTVSVHPVQKSYFITAGHNRVASLWDLRSIKKKSIADVELSRSISSAFFSPVTGNSVLTTSYDNKLCVFDTKKLKGPMELKKAIRHDNKTGRWLTPFRAVWLPYNEDAFVVGSMLQPRRIEVYRTSGNLIHNFAGEDLASVCSINAFHPSKPILAGGNSSGKVHVFKSKE